MKLYAFTDIHGNTKALQAVKAAISAKGADLAACTGDLTVFEHDTHPLLSRVNLLRVPVLMIHGNHEREERFKKACAQYPRLTFLHQEAFMQGGWTFLGYGGGGFEARYPDFEDWLKSPLLKAVDWRRTVLLTHAPPYGTALDNVGDGDATDEAWHVGSKTLRDLIKKRQPRLVLCGHIHEGFGKEERIGGTLVVNPGPNGKLFDLENL